MGASDFVKREMEKHNLMSTWDMTLYAVKHKDELRKEITDVESLLKFPLKHGVSSSEYTDWQARAVYEECIEKYKKGELKN